MTTTETLSIDSADNQFERAGRIRKSYRLASTLRDISEEQGVDAIALLSKLNDSAWYGIVREADIRYPVDTQTHLPSQDTVEAVRGILNVRSVKVANAALRSVLDAVR